MVSISTLLLLNIVLSAIMTGIIWLVQLVIYPSFEKAKSTEFQVHHVKSIGPIVALLMIIELMTMMYVLTTDQHIILISAAVCLVIIWLSTFLIQVPIHNQIQKNFDNLSIKRLILSNWIRTIFWTLKSILLLGYAAS